MAEDFRKYLATEILSEQRTISYRNVSRSLKVHANAAKCMLYEFYKDQHDKKPDSIYATYLIAGVKKDQKRSIGKHGTTNGHSHDYDEDEPIPSSPPPFTSSMLEPTPHSSQPGEDNKTQIPVRTVTLAREEGLESVKEQYETITSIHIYSLSPGRIEDLVTLTDVGRGLFTDSFMKEDPLVQNKIYGVIQNPGARRRKGKRPIAPAEPISKFQPVKDDPKKSNSFFPTKATAKQSTTMPEPKKEKEESRPSSRDSTSAAGATKPSTLKRDSSDLFKAFAKQSQQKPKSTLSRDHLQDQDTKMSDAPPDEDEGESEDEALFLDTGTHKAGTKKRPSDVKKERDDRAAKLRKMMDSDDESDSAVSNVGQANRVKTEEPVKAQKGTDADAPAEDKDEVAWSESDTEKKSKKASDPAASEPSGPKRRRGKRKIMKKRTTKDEDGYLVTKEEAVWESFSEEEPEPAPSKPAPAKPAFGKSQPTQSQGKASGKAGAKKAGGNIMSFFGKKP
jgi:DNA polymerase delta subunit 3